MTTAPSLDRELTDYLAGRISPLHLRRRLGLEDDIETRMSGRAGGPQRFTLERWLLAPGLIKIAMRLVFLYNRARRNALNIALRHNRVIIPGLPAPFAGYKILQVSDPHFDCDPEFPAALAAAVGGADYDLCVFTGDYRFRTYGPTEATLAGAREVCARLRAPAYGILGNHDSLRMVPALEAMGIRLLLNESVDLERDGARLNLTGVDDPHYYRTDNLDHACDDLPADGTALLLAHTPEFYRHAAHAGFQLMLCGHTHGGQLCLPGGIAVIVEARVPRRLAAGAWRYHELQGYTSVGAGCSILAVRLNCPPEITLHELWPTAN